MVLRGLGCGLSPFWGFCVPIGLVWSYDTRSVRGYSIHTLSLSRSAICDCLSINGCFSLHLRNLSHYKSIFLYVSLC